MAGNGLLLFLGGWVPEGVAYIAFGVTENFNIFHIVGEYLGWEAMKEILGCYCAWNADLILLELRIDSHHIFRFGG